MINQLSSLWPENQNLNPVATPDLPSPFSPSPSLPRSRHHQAPAPTNLRLGVTLDSSSPLPLTHSHRQVPLALPAKGASVHSSLPRSHLHLTRAASALLSSV